MRSLTVVGVTLAIGVASCVNAAGTRVVLSTLPTDPTSLVPGTTSGRLETDFGALYRSPDGSRWVIQSRATIDGVAADVVLIGSGLSASTGFRGDIEVPWQVMGSQIFSVTGSVTDQYAVNNDGDFAFGIDEAGAVEVLVLNNSGSWSVVAREGDAIPFDTGRFWPGSGFDVAGVSADGASVSYRVVNAPTNPATTNVSYLVVNGVPVLTTGTTTPTGQLTSPDRAYDSAGGSTYFKVSGDASSWIAFASLAGTTSNDDLMVVNNAVVAQESFAFATTTANSRLAGPDISGNGQHTFFRGQATDGTTNWIARNGAIIASSGQPIFTGASETWANVSPGFSRTFFQVAGNDAGNYVIIGGTSGAAPANGVVVYNNSRVLLRQRDPIDVNGNGLFDDNVFASLADTGSELYTAFLSNDGYLYITVQIVDAAATDLGEAVLRIPVSLGDFNGIGGVTVQDIFDFLAAYFAGSPTADVNGVGGVTVQDIFDFLGAYFGA